MRDKRKQKSGLHWAPLAKSAALLEWWYRRTAPPWPGVDEPLPVREVARQGRLSSVILLLSIGVLLVVLIGSLLDRNVILLLIILVALLVQGIAVRLNRRGKVLLVGLFVVLWFMLGLSMFLFTIPGGLKVANLPAFYLLIEPELLAVSLLPAWSVFVVGGYNSLLIFCDLAFFPHTPELDRLLASSSYQVIFQPILLQIVVAVVLYLWVRSATQAIARADRAEEIAQLQKFIAQQERERQEALEAERQILHAYEQQQKIKVLKDELLAHMGHELRTPLTAMGGYLELLTMYGGDVGLNERNDFLAKVVESHAELVDLVNTILDALLITEEFPHARCEQVGVSSLIREVVEHLDPREARTRQIETRADDEMTVWADPQFLRQILRNLLSNALKYTMEETVIRVEVTRRDEAAPVCISIQDNGPGIPPEELSQLFEKFARLKRDRKGAVRGSGLGLYICKQLVEAMDGHIWVESTGVPGEGSQFKILLPSVAPDQ